MTIYRKLALQAVFLFVVSTLAAAPSQLAIGPTNKLSLAAGPLPAAPPYSTVTLWRTEWRQTIPASASAGWGGPGANLFISQNSFAGYRVFVSVFVAGVSYQYVVNDGRDGGVQFGCPPVNFGQDALFRLQRNSNNFLTCETWNVDGSNYQIITSSILPTPVTGISGTLEVGDATHDYGKLAFLRSYSSAVPLNSKPPFGNAGGNLWDYEFNNNLLDSSGNGLTLNGVGTLSYTPAPTYPPACILPPQTTFRAGFQTTALTGANSFPLNGSSSLTYLWQQVPGNLTVTPPSILKWSDQANINPTVQGFLSGSYTIHLAVTDSSGVTSACSQKYGVIATDVNGSVIISNPSHQLIIPAIMGTNLNPWTSYDPTAVSMAHLVMQKMAGSVLISAASATNPMVLTMAPPSNTQLALYPGSLVLLSGATGSGCSSMNTTLAVTGVVGNLITVNFDGTACTYGANSAHSTAPFDYQFHDYWNEAQPGTITVTGGSAAIVGAAGTTFTTTFGTGSTTIKHPGSTAIVVWYPIGASFGYPAGTTGRRWCLVTSIFDDTHMTVDCSVANGLSTGWITDTNILAGSGLSYSYIEFAQGNPDTHSTSGWGQPGSSTPGNYYDNVLALYALYYRTGIDDFLIAARKLADTWWTHWGYDRGLSYEATSGNFWGNLVWAPRAMSMTGIFLRATDNPPIDMWPGIRAVMAQQTGAAVGGGYTPQNCAIVGPATPFAGNNYDGTHCSGDVRENGYSAFFVALSALLDPITANKQSSLDALHRDLNNRWTPSAYFPTGTQVYWPQGDNISGAYASWQTGGTLFTATVSGAGVVTPSAGGTFDPAKFPTGTFGCSNSANNPAIIWFTNTGTSFPFSNPSASSADTIAYYVKYVGPTLQLIDCTGTNVTYTGTAGSGKGWQTNTGNTSATVGYPMQPYMSAMASRMFYYMWLAFSTIQKSGGGFYTADATTASDYSLKFSNFMNATLDRTIGTLPATPTNGVYYVIMSPNCTPPTFFWGCVDASTGNTNVSDTQRQLNSEAIGSAMWAHLLLPSDTTSLTLGNLMMAAQWATIGTPGYDGFNVVNDYAPGQFFYFSSTQHKYLGQPFGFGADWAWPSVALGGLIPALPRIVNISYTMPTGGTQAAFTVTKPDGATVTTTCTGSAGRNTCALTAFDVREGPSAVSVVYTLSGGLTLRTNPWDSWLLPAS